MTDFASLVLAVDSSTVPKGAADLQRLSAVADKVETSVVASTMAMTDGFKDVSAAAAATPKGFGLAGGGARMLTGQMSQMVQQSMAGGNVLQAIAIQLPDIGLAFGAVGTVVGVLGAIALPALGAALFGTSKDAEKLAEQMDVLQGAASRAKNSAQDLADAYGSADAQMVSMLRTIAAVDRLEAMREMAVAVSDIADSVGDLFATNKASGSKGFLTSVGVDMGVDLAQAKELQGAIDRLSRADGFDAQAAAAQDLSAQLFAAYGSVAAMPPEFQRMAKHLAEANIAVGDMGAVLPTVAESLQGVGSWAAVAARESGNIAGSTDQAAASTQSAANAAYSLASGLGVAAGQASSLAAFLSAVPGALSRMAVQAAGATAGLAAIQAGMGAGAAGAAKYRAELEATAGDLATMQDGQRKYVTESIDAQVAAYEQSTAATDAYSEALKNLNTVSGGSSGGGAVAAAEAIADETERAAEAAKEYADTMAGYVTSSIDGAVDWLVSGFEGGFDSLLTMFKDTWSDMIGFALKNQINGLMGIGADGSMTGAAGSFTSALTSSLSGGLGSLFNISANIAAAGGGLAATLGALAGPLGLVAGLFAAIIPKVTVLAAGLNVSIDGFDIAAEEFKKVQKSYFFGLIKTTKTTANAVSEETAKELERVYGAISDAVHQSAGALGVASDAFNDFAYDFTVNTEGMDSEQASQAIADEFERVQDAMAELALAGMGLEFDDASDYLDKLAASLIAVNEANGLLGKSLLSTSVEMGVFAADIVDAFGSLEDFIAGTSFYFENFYTTQEQITALTSQLAADLGALGVSGMPTTIEGFRALIDATTDPVLAASLMALSDEFMAILGLSEELATEATNGAQAALDEAKRIADERYDLETQLLELQGNTLALRERELALLDPTNVALQEQIWNLQDMQKAVEELNETDFASLFDYQRAVARGNASANVTGSPYVPGAPVTQSSSMSATGDPVVIELQAVRAEIMAQRAEQAALVSQVSSYTKSQRDVLKRWDAEGLPAVRT